MSEMKSNCVIVGEGKRMSVFASLLRTLYKLSGVKKVFTLPEDKIRKKIEKENRHRGVFIPSDNKAHYEMIEVNGFKCLIVKARPEPSQRAILFFFGGGMVIGPDKGDLKVVRKLMYGTHSDVWFPFYPLCMEHCITETYDMAWECYKRMIEIYGEAMSAHAAFHREVHWHSVLPYTTMPSLIPSRSRDMLLQYPLGKCRGTMRKRSV